MSEEKSYPVVNVVFPLTGSVKVEGWELGDSIQVIEYVGVGDGTDNVAYCRNITKSDLEYIDVTLL